MAKKKEAKGLTENQLQYKDIANKLRRKIRDINKRGFIIPENVLSYLETPKRVTKRQIERLEKIRKNIYEYAVYRNPLTEEIIKGTERRKQERQTAARKAAESRRRKREQPPEREEWENYEPLPPIESLPNEEEAILEQLFDLIRNWQPSPLWSEELKKYKQSDKQLLENIVNGAIDSLGRLQVARNIKSRQTEFFSLVNEVLYGSGNKYAKGRDNMRVSFATIRAILYNRVPTVIEAIELEDLYDNTDVEE